MFLWFQQKEESSKSPQVKQTQQIQAKWNWPLAALSDSPHKCMHGHSWIIPWPSLAGHRCKRHTLVPRTQCEALWPHQLVLQQLQCLQLQLEDRLGAGVARSFVQLVIQPTAGQIGRNSSRLSGMAHAARHHWEPGRCPGRVHSWQSKLPVQRAPHATRSTLSHRPLFQGEKFRWHHLPQCTYSQTGQHICAWHHQSWPSYPTFDSYCSCVRLKNFTNFCGLERLHIWCKVGGSFAWNGDPGSPRKSFFRWRNGSIIKGGLGESGVHLNRKRKVRWWCWAIRGSLWSSLTIRMVSTFHTWSRKTKRLICGESIWRE